MAISLFLLLPIMSRSPFKALLISRPDERRAVKILKLSPATDTGGGASSPPMRVSPRRYANVSRFLEGRRAVARALESRHV